MFEDDVRAFFKDPTGNYEQELMSEALADELEKLTVSAIDGGARPADGGPVASFEKVRLLLLYLTSVAPAIAQHRTARQRSAQPRTRLFPYLLDMPLSLAAQCTFCFGSPADSGPFQAPFTQMKHAFPVAILPALW
jgi:hypothetical protein